jgi:hypothetical protein
MPSYAKDKFDLLPDDLTRFGVHRSPPRKGRGWMGLLWALLATGVLVVGGILGLNYFYGIDLGLPFLSAAATPTPTPTPTPTMDPVLDPSTIAPERAIDVSVLNGTPTVGLQDTAGDVLTAAGWKVASRTVASLKDVDYTVVYYSDPLNEDVARGVVVALGIGDIRLVAADTFPGAKLTLVIGADYPVPTPGATPAP